MLQAPVSCVSGDCIFPQLMFQPIPMRDSRVVEGVNIKRFPTGPPPPRCILDMQKVHNFLKGSWSYYERFAAPRDGFSWISPFYSIF